MTIPKLETAHLNLDATWGPFSPIYLGASRLLGDQGNRADLALHVSRCTPAAGVMPDPLLFYQTKTDGKRLETLRVTPEDVAADFSTWSLRYHLDAHGDNVLARFVSESEKRLHVDLTFQNTSDEDRKYQFGCGLFAFETGKIVFLKAPLKPWWVPASSYKQITSFRKSFGLGNRQNITRICLWSIEDEVLAQAFGGWAEDRVVYETTLPRPMDHAFVYLRFIKYSNVNPPWELSINGRSVTFQFVQTWPLPGGWGKSPDAYPEWRLLRVPLGRLSETNLTITLRPLDPPGNDHAQIWLDGLLFQDGYLAGDDGTTDLLPSALCEEALRKNARVEQEPRSEPGATFRLLGTNELDYRATLVTDGVSIRATSGEGSFLETLRSRFDLPPARLERDTTGGPWGAVESDAIAIPARSTRTVHFTLDIESARAPAKEPTHRPTASGGTSAPPNAVMPAAPRGPYGEMIARLRDVALFNVNYPLKLFGRPTAICVPAKFFPVPYSWDAGFVAVGLASSEPELALQHTAFFMTEETCEWPFLHCSSPVPTQIYAWWEIYQATQDLNVLSTLYPRVKRMYDFFLGRTPGSLVHPGGDGLLSTYPYYYNLGIDDHPIQVWAEERDITNRGLYSLILISQILRCARIFRNAAALLDRREDTDQFARDADLLAGVIDDRMWDEQSGLYGWLFKTDQGVERVALDGCTGDQSACAFLPLFSGQTAHTARLLDAMRDPARFHTPNGVSSVDMSAPSFNPNGYWNGGIWPVMQWYLWRGLLEAGEPAQARQVAEAILATWQRCWAQEHYLGEHFHIARERMSGALNFGGLSAVLLAMHAAYFDLYKVTTCYNVVVLAKSVDPTHDALSLSLSGPFPSSASHDLLVNMGGANTHYTLTVNGQPSGEFISDSYGHLSLRLPWPKNQEELKIQPLGLKRS